MLFSYCADLTGSFFYQLLIDWAHGGLGNGRQNVLHREPAHSAVFIWLAADGRLVVSLEQIRRVQVQVGADELSALDVRRDVQDFERENFRGDRHAVRFYF